MRRRVQGAQRPSPQEARPDAGQAGIRELRVPEAPTTFSGKGLPVPK